jgi:hypothetical protein
MGLGAAGLKKTHPAQWVGLEDFLFVGRAFENFL